MWALLKFAGQALAPGQLTWQVLGVVDLDHDIGALVEARLALISEPAGFLLGFFQAGRFQLVHVEAVAVDVPAMDDRNEPAHAFTFRPAASIAFAQAFRMLTAA